MKFYLIGLMTILMTGAVGAQHVNVGIKGGLNVYNVYHDNGSRLDSKLGFHAGLLGHIHIAKHFGLQPEIVYSTQGAQYTYGNVNTKFNLDYINVPLLFQLMFGEGFRVHVGPQVGFLVSAKSNTNDFIVNNKNDIAPIDLGVTFGASYVHMKSGFGVDARYNLGLNSIHENNSMHSTNRGFQLGLFYLFNHKS